MVTQFTPGNWMHVAVLCPGAIGNRSASVPLKEGGKKRSGKKKIEINPRKRHTLTH